MFLTYYLDPDPHSLKKLDLDLHKVNGDPKHCTGVLIFFIGVYAYCLQYHLQKVII
jgi:hypothetical protein